jgi:hypothetical protein
MSFCSAVAEVGIVLSDLAPKYLFVYMKHRV